MSSLELRNVTVAVRGKRLIEDVSLSLRAGEFVALLGPNGAGKTTLLKAALGLMPSRGEVLLDGRDGRRMSGRERAGLAAWLPQHSQIVEAISALELVMAARYRFSETHPSAERAAMGALEHAGAGRFAGRVASELSGGERQRVAVAALLAQEAPLLLLDEPANHLDPAQQIELYALIGRLWREGRGVLCITHDINMLRHVGSPDVRVVGMAQGRVRFETTYGAANLAQHVGGLFGVHMDVVEAGGQRLLVHRESA